MIKMTIAFTNSLCLICLVTVMTGCKEEPSSTKDQQQSEPKSELREPEPTPTKKFTTPQHTASQQFSEKKLSKEQPAHEQKSSQPISVPPVYQSNTQQTQAQFSQASASLSASPKTTEEQQASIQQKLDASLTEFDSILNREQAFIDKQIPRHEPSNEASSGYEAANDHQINNNDRISNANNSTIESESESESGPQSEDKQQASAGFEGREKPSNQIGTTSTKQKGSIMDGRDDDVVARQIREAAEQETDPELKEKLWREYRNYKDSQ